jgi:hypothetical protein
MPGRRSSWWEVNNYASAMYLTNKTADALVFAREAIALKRNVATLINISVILDELGRHSEALNYAEEAYRSDTTSDLASARLAELLLRSGLWRAAWPHWIRNRASMDWCKHWLPEWTGGSRRFKRILVIEGGGYGDNLYFFRWLRTLRQWGTHIDYVCDPSFAPLARSQGVDVILNYHGNADIRWERYDYFVPLLAIPGRLGIALEQDKGLRYINVKGRSAKPTRLIGLCHRAGEAISPRRQRTLHNEQIQMIVDALPSTYKWVQMTHKMIHPQIEGTISGDWLETAKVMNTLDLLITVDTATAHLAGAMGIPTIVMIPGACSWYYILGQDWNPLYPAMRVHRNMTEGLDQAVAMTCAALRRLK